MFAAWRGRLLAVVVCTAAGTGLHAQESSSMPAWDSSAALEPEEAADAFWQPPGHLQHRRFAGWVSQALPQHARRHIGWGQPLEGTSWLNRPAYAGWIVGTWWGDSLVSDRVDQDSGLFAVYMLGYDLSHYWGSEMRLGLFYSDINYLPSGTAGGSSRNLLGDVSLLYYPWGDARWRPYAALGIGLGGFHCLDADNRPIDHTGISLPFGFGVKYQVRHWLAARMDLKDNLVFGGHGVNTTNNWTLTGGVEIHWGRGNAAQYYPW